MSAIRKGKYRGKYRQQHGTMSRIQRVKMPPRIDRSLRVNWDRAKAEARQKFKVYKQLPHCNAQIYNGVDGMTVGIVGEMEFSRVFQRPRRLFNLDGSGDGGWDYQIGSDDLVDVKTTTTACDPEAFAEGRIDINPMFNLQVRADLGPLKGKADIYCLAWVPFGFEMVRLVGWCWREELTVRPTKSFGHGVNWWVPIGELHPIDELLDLHTNA